MKDRFYEVLGSVVIPSIEATFRTAGTAARSTDEADPVPVTGQAATTAVPDGGAPSPYCPCECHDKRWAHGLDRSQSVCCDQWNRVRADMR